MKMHFINNTEVNPPRKLAFDNTAETAAMQDKLNDVHSFISDIISELIENDYNYLTPRDADGLSVDDLGRAEDVLMFLYYNFKNLWGKA